MVLKYGGHLILQHKMIDGFLTFSDDSWSSPGVLSGCSNLIPARLDENEEKWGGVELAGGEIKITHR